ncbi:dihydroneopterin aldolase [Pelagibacteraceae bacterium]|nr:dihydroneopterin aldolase [Pelagibacteraceae bacterium]
MSEKKIIHLKDNISSEEEIILINDLILNAKFGFYEYEKLKEQKIIFNLKLFIIPKTYEDKSLEEIVDYDQVINKIKKIISDPINFLETLANKIINEIFKDQRVFKVSIKIEKPEAIKECKSVGYEVTKVRNF